MSRILNLLRTYRNHLRERLINQAGNTIWMCVGIAFLSLVGIVFYGYLVYLTQHWQYQVLVGASAVILVICVLGIFLTRRGYSRLATWLALLGVLSGTSLGPFMFEELAYWYAVSTIFSVLLISNLSMNSRDRFRAGLIGVSLALLDILVNDLLPIWQIAPMEQVTYFVAGQVILQILLYLFSLLILFPDYTLRGKITIAVYSAAIISIVVLAAIYTQTYRVALLESINRTLLLASQRTADDIDAYIEGLFPRLEEVAEDPNLGANYLSISLEDQSKVLEVTEDFQLAHQELEALELYLLDRRGYVVMGASDVYQSDQYERYAGLSIPDQQAIDTCVMTGLRFVSSVVFPKPERPTNLSQPQFFIGSRIVDSEGYPMGFIMAAYPIADIQRIVEANNYLAGDQSFGVLLDDNYMRISHGAAPSLNYSLVTSPDIDLADLLITTRRIPVDFNVVGTDEYKIGLNRISFDSFFETQEEGFVDDLNSAAGVRLRMKNWIIVFMQPRSIILMPIEQQTRATLLITTLISGFAILVSALLARLISNPISRLTDSAERASAGDLSRQVPVSSSDEIGKLGVAFNNMIGQLKTTLQGLEARVKERTTELLYTNEQLEYRANRLQMVAEVAQIFASVTDPDQLLSVVVKTISERFGFYHVGIFKIDRFGEYAALVAANSPGGQKMLERGHRLRVGEQGLVGHVTQHRSARIALDVDEDEVYFNNPDLPETRSEITLPLVIGDRLFGALDVQSTLPNAFDASDIALLSTLANQVAVAIEYNRLINEARNMAREIELSQRQYLQQEWGKLIEEQGARGYQYKLGNLQLLPSDEAINREDVPKAPAIVSHEVVDASLPIRSGMVVPIVLRGQTIGLIELDETTSMRNWSADEIDLVTSVADQVGLALENARLLDTTRRRAERERLVSEITSKLRSSNDPQEILDTAVAQLKQALRVHTVKVHVKAEPDDDASGSNNTDEGDSPMS